MSFQFHEASCVVAGTFNIYVFQPDFFVHTEIVEEGEKAKLQADFSQPGFLMSFLGSPIRWVIRPDRIMAESRSEESDCGRMVANILKALPWTPISAIGLNFEFIASRDDFQTMNGRNLIPATDLSLKVTQRTVHVGIKENGQLFNLSLAQTDEKIVCAINVHTDLKLADKTRLEVSTVAEGIARGFQAFRTKSVDLAREAFGVDIDYANDHDKY